MTNNKALRNYNIKIDTIMLENEYIIIANNKLKELLNSRSVATISTYLYICLNVNKSKDKGYLRNIRCKDISDFLGIPLSTIQDAIKTLTKKNFIKRTFKDDRSSDYKVIGYNNILDKPYSKIPSSLVFNNTFLRSSKDEVAGLLDVFSSIFTNTVASMKKLQSISFLKDKQNYELIDQAEVGRVFSKDNLLSKIKRCSNKDLKRVLDKMRDLGLSVTNTFKKGISKSVNYVISINKDTLKSLFRPYISRSHKDNNPLAFEKVDKILCQTGLYKHFNNSHYEDLTQMYVEYGDLYFNAGVVAMQGVLHNNYSLIDQSGDNIDNLCAYFRTSVETFIEKCQLPATLKGSGL